MSQSDNAGEPHRATPTWRSKKAAQTGVVALVVLALLAVLGQRFYRAQQVVSANSATAATHGTTSTHPAALTVAPDFTLHTWAWWTQTHSTATDPTQEQLAALRGKPIVINFWASWCDACRAEAPAMERAWRAYQARGVVFLGIDVNDTATDSAVFLKQYGITYYNAPDVTGTIYVQYGVIGLPTTVFVNRYGAVQSKHIGEINKAALDSGIESLLK